MQPEEIQEKQYRFDKDEGSDNQEEDVFLLYQRIVECPVVGVIQDQPGAGQEKVGDLED